MKNALIALAIAITVAVIGHFTQWFGFTRPAIDAVRAEAKARIDATDTKVASNTARIESGEQKTVALEKTTQQQVAQIQSVDERITQSAKTAADASRAATDDVKKLNARVDANTKDIGEIKARIERTTEEAKFDQELTNAMVLASQLKVAFAEAIQTEGRAPDSNAKVGAPAPERYADGALTRIAIERGEIVAQFNAANPNPNPRFKLIPQMIGADTAGPIRWKCVTNMPVASRLFTTCELKTSI
jgi:azurin